MEVEKFLKILNTDFYIGVPDSLLRELCDYLINTYGMDSKHHIIAANEGNCVALAAGYYLATGNIPVVYMQNSGEGNIINPYLSLLSEEVYAIPVILVIGWRGEPGEKDEAQHICQGRLTIKLLESLGISTYVLDKKTSEADVYEIMEDFRRKLNVGKCVAFVIRKNTFTYGQKLVYQNENHITREEIIREILKYSGNEPVVSTTGKASRELYEVREEQGQGHKHDFLSVGAMGHSSSIALGIALHKPNTRIWCVDGDGAALMHMGAMAVIGANTPNNLVHVVINNSAHETVGGMPTVAGKIDLCAVARACGYRYVVCVSTLEQLGRELGKVRLGNELSFIEVKCAIGARGNLGRPKISALKNKEIFMEHLKSFE